MKKRFATTIFAAVSIAGVYAQSATPVPRLVIGITVDQLRSDYLEAFSPLYGDRGFKRLLREGRVYTNAQYPTANVDRASSVATVYTGTVPYNHGIVGEEWLDRASMRPVYCVDDFKYKGVGTSDYSSPKNILVSTIGDELKVATDGKAMVYAISPYRDMSVLAAGHAGDWAMWIDNSTGGWGGSTYYGDQPGWLKYFDINGIGRNISDYVWEPSNYVVGKFNYYVYGETSKSFKHKFNGDRKFRVFKNSACVNGEVTKLASFCLSNSGIGSDAIPDMLSLTYFAGRFDNKPMSECAMELQDTYVRLDAELATLLENIDKNVGLSNTLIFITSTGYDHEDAGDISKYRIPTGELKINRCAALLNMYLIAVYGQGQYVESYYGNNLYLNHKLIEDKQLNMKEVLERCEELLLQYTGVKDVYTSQRLMQGAWTPGISRIRNSYNPKCSGDIFIEVVPGWNLVNDDLLSSKYIRDSYFEFPLIFFGYGIKSDSIAEPVTVDCIAPTLTHFMRIRAPNGCSSAPLTDVK